MAINNVNNAGHKAQLESQRLNQQQLQQGQSANNSQQAQQAGKARQDLVSLTQSAQQLTNAQKKGNDTPVDQEKVDRLKASIQRGEYRVDPEKLAGNIARTESQLFGATKS